jgi:hypothetical protein
MLTLVDVDVFIAHPNRLENLYTLEIRSEDTFRSFFGRWSAATGIDIQDCKVFWGDVSIELERLFLMSKRPLFMPTQNTSS